jgi:hypothetical protein
VSIWSSVFPDEVAGRECRASDLKADTSDNYAGTGNEDLHVDVATATSWHNATRLSVDNYPGPMDVCVLLSVDAIDTLIAMLTVAKNRIARAGATDG